MAQPEHGSHGGDAWGGVIATLGGAAAFVALPLPGALLALGLGGLVWALLLEGRPIPIRRRPLLAGASVVLAVGGLGLLVVRGADEQSENQRATVSTPQPNSTASLSSPPAPTKTPTQTPTEIPPPAATNEVPETSLEYVDLGTLDVFEGESDIISADESEPPTAAVTVSVPEVTDAEPPVAPEV